MVEYSELRQVNSMPGDVTNSDQKVSFAYTPNQDKVTDILTRYVACGLENTRASVFSHKPPHAKSFPQLILLGCVK